jgi:hypothetical protein
VRILSTAMFASAAALPAPFFAAAIDVWSWLVLGHMVTGFQWDYGRVVLSVIFTFLGWGSFLLGLGAFEHGA